jgi:hypothetical protein
MKLKVTLGEIYESIECEIKYVTAMIDEETDEVLKNELRQLKSFLNQSMLRAHQCLDIKLEKSRQAAINIKGKRT